MPHPAHDRSLARRGADHRRTVGIGIGASALVHAALLAWLTFPAVTTPAATEFSSFDEIRSAPSNALQLISLEIPEAEAPDAAAAAAASAPSGSRTSGGSAAPVRPDPTREQARVSETAPTVERIADVVEPVRVAARYMMAEPEFGALGEMSAIEAPDAAPLTGHEGHLHTLAEQEGPGFWQRLAEGLQISVSSGGHCPMDGDLIQQARGRGFAIPQDRTTGLGLPRAGGFTIPQTRGVGVRLPGGIGR